MSFSALSLVVSYELIQIVRNPFNAMENNRVTYMVTALLGMVLVAPLLFYVFYGLPIYFIGE
jgi:uncharacterized membrane protein YqhA